MVHQKRNPDLNTKPQAKIWFESQPDSYHHFILAKNILLSHYFGSNHGYINMARRPEYRFNRADDGYVDVKGGKRFTTVRFYGLPRKYVSKQFVKSHCLADDIVEFKVADEKSAEILKAFLGDSFHKVRNFRHVVDIDYDCDDILDIKRMLNVKEVDKEIINQILREVWCRTSAHTKFRRELLKKWNDRCALTGISNPDLLVASHIKPWAKSQENKEERWEQTCVDNGLILASPIDRLFDQGFLSFDDNGAVLIHDDWSGHFLTNNELLVFGLQRDEKRRLRDVAKNLNPRLKDFLAYHRREVFGIRD